MEERSRQTTVLFADVSGSTRLYETAGDAAALDAIDRKSTRLNSSHGSISYASFYFSSPLELHPFLHDALPISFPPFPPGLSPTRPRICARADSALAWRPKDGRTK